jgi:hypothetical protein
VNNFSANAPIDSFGGAMLGNYNQSIKTAQHILIFEKFKTRSPLAQKTIATLIHKYQV